VTTLIFGFVTFTQSIIKSELNNEVLYLIILGIVFSISSIVTAISVLSIRKYLFPLDIDAHFKDKNFEPDPATIHEKDIGEYFRLNKLLDISQMKMIAHYIAFIKVIHHKNENKAELVNVFLGISVVFVGLTAAATSWSPPTTSSDSEGKFTCIEPDTATTRMINDSQMSDSAVTGSKIMICFSS